MLLPTSLHTLREDLLSTEIAIVFVLRHYANKISGASISRAMGISPDKLQRGFKVLTQLSVDEYICLVRLERAKELLEDNLEPIDRIVRMTGFRDECHFRNVFSEATATTPEAYRLLHIEEPLLKLSANYHEN